MKSFVVFAVAAWLAMPAVAHADILLKEPSTTAVYYSDGNGYSYAGGGPNSFASGTVLAGGGNGIGYVHEGNNAGMYAIGETLYRSLGSFSAGTVMAGLGDGTALAKEGGVGAIYLLSPDGYSYAGGAPNSFASGTVLAGAGNGIGYAHEGNNAGMYALGGTLYKHLGAFDAGTVMAGLGDGTALAKEGSGAGTLYLLTPNGPSYAGGGQHSFDSGTVLAGAGNGVGFVHEGGNGGMYAIGETLYQYLGAFGAGMLVGAGNGIGYAMDGTDLYRLTSTGYSLVDNFTSPYALCGSGDGSAFVLDASNDTLYHVGASGTGSTIVGVFADGTIMANIGVPVPEPAAITTLIMGILGLLAYAWRKRQ